MKTLAVQVVPDRLDMHAELCSEMESTLDELFANVMIVYVAVLVPKDSQMEKSNVIERSIVLPVRYYQILTLFSCSKFYDPLIDCLYLQPKMLVNATVRFDRICSEKTNVHVVSDLFAAFLGAQQ